MTAKTGLHQHKKKVAVGGKKSAGPQPLPPGLAAREVAVRLIAGVLQNGRSLEEVLASTFASGSAGTLPARDRGLARLIAGTVARRLGELEAVLKSFLDKPLDQRKGGVWPILLSGAAQLLFLETPPHAAISLAVDQVRRDRHGRHFDRLVNAVLRRVASDGPQILEGTDRVRANIPAWLYTRWVNTYGEEGARRIAEASLREAPLDVSVKADAEAWADRLGGAVLRTGSVRLSAGGRIEDFPGYVDGGWWVQDAGAALPALLFGPVSGQRIADLCAAPGGKTAQLAAAGAKVTAVDVSDSRLARLRTNLERLDLKAELVAADATTWQPDAAFDGILLDAPCTSTGTIRRHPDILRLKRNQDIGALAALQARLLDHAVTLVKPGGILVYCTCSLEPEEGEHQIAQLLNRNDGLERVPIRAGENGLPVDWITPDGDLRTLPCHLSNEHPDRSGIDGFYAARLICRG